jgi:hypothetical protein
MERGDRAALEGQHADRRVLAEWALWGKDPDDLEYSVLRWSRGAFGRGDFREMITRYTSGATEALPQYTVFWIPEGNGHEPYLAVGIHELADPDPGRSGGRTHVSRGRQIQYIRLFCVPYSEMARSQAGYTELVESVVGHQLPPGLTCPIQVELLENEKPYITADFAALARNVAALLLTSRPVCVLGADQVNAEDRLRFIDYVASLLPYGLRATLSASTWASATARDLKLRLFFSSAARDDHGRTCYATWGQPERIDLSALGLWPLKAYKSWLEHSSPGTLEELATQTSPIRFNADAAQHIVAELQRDRPVGDLLERLTGGICHAQPPGIQQALKQLRRYTAQSLSLDERTTYCQKIKRLGLLNKHQKLNAAAEASIYSALLTLAFGAQLSYANYCEIEDCVGGPPHVALSQEMLRLRFSAYLPWLLTCKSGTTRNDQELMELLQQQGVEAAAPLDEFYANTRAVRPAHRAVWHDFAVGYLLACSAAPQGKLAERGYLAETLEQVFPHDQQAQRVR